MGRYFVGVFGLDLGLGLGLAGIIIELRHYYYRREFDEQS